ncbi:MAG: N-acetylmuramoyl-L-alanine amidase, partial [Erysipelotrichia bacterium]|nr:N-acetylmuramoyl-L-alanine amidase [Erysipelotrichia bacterium]
ALLSCEIEIAGEVKLYTKYVYILGRTDKEKIAIVKAWLDDQYTISHIDENTQFVTTDEAYQARIIWTPQNESIVNKNLEFTCPLYDTKIAFSVAIGIGASSSSFYYIFNVFGKEHENTWSKIEDFLNRINTPQIKTQRFSLYGYEVGYENVPSENIGYLPFYDEQEMEIIQSILPDSSPLKPNRMRSATRYIVIHNTGMAHPTATAKGLDEYIHSTDRVASWHFSIDDKETYQQVVEEQPYCYYNNCDCKGWLEIHHVFGKYNRDKSTKYKLLVRLCDYHHENNANDLELKQHFQRKFEEENPELDFLKLFGRNYL